MTTHREELEEIRREFMRGAIINERTTRLLSLCERVIEELEQIDALLARRNALDLEPTRFGKIQLALRTLEKIDPKGEGVARVSQPKESEV